MSDGNRPCDCGAKNPKPGWWHNVWCLAWGDGNA